MTLEQVLADAREEANVLRVHSHRAQAESIDKVCAAVATMMADYLTWLNEADAELYTGLKTPALRARFASLQQRGLAKWDHERRQRMYRRVALEHRGNNEAAREAGRRAAQSTSPAARA
jgi:hypothetical protein